GLAQAFLFAGARSLLVSHWSVDDLSARQLMVETMRRYVEVPGTRKAAALRFAMQTVRSTPGLEHPFFWAPFDLVGTGDRPTRDQDRLAMFVAAAESGADGDLGLPSGTADLAQRPQSFLRGSHAPGLVANGGDPLAGNTP
ncbi:MAG: CHAT domain-containing protein, partial [Rhodobacteraceae bacterium]|nr:CHAT domain-containing protein [Paracoccaceae bacterium]